MIDGPLVGAIHESLTSILFAIYKAGTDEIVCYHKMNVPHICPQEGWIEKDPLLIVVIVIECIEAALRKLIKLGGSKNDIVALGIANQRESTVIWDKSHGLPLYNAIISTDLRTTTNVEYFLNKTNYDINFLKELCGLPISPYYSALKICWLIDNVPDIRKSITNGTCLFGTIDSWLIWNLTGNYDCGIHITDVTNASRTMLMNINSRKWDPVLLNFFGIPKTILPEIRSCSEFYGKLILTTLNCPITSCLGDQQAELIGEQCTENGQAKCTYDYDFFFLYNTGSRAYQSENGLITTIAYQFGNKAKPIYALEGRIPHAGIATQWLQDNLQLTTSNTIYEDYFSVPDCGDVYFVPAFVGLHDPHWDLDARGIIVGLSEKTKPNHIIRASVEANCYQIRDILEAIGKDSGNKLKTITVIGKVIEDKLLLQLLSDLSGIDIVVPKMYKSSAALGAALAAYRVIIEKDVNLKKEETDTTTIYTPNISEETRNIHYTKWKQAVQKSFGWKSIQSESESSITTKSYFSSSS